jgi:hypothetical protein
VEDNGCGISPDKVAQSKGFGILGIRERAWGIGGEIEFHRALNSGTRVVLRVPLSGDLTIDDVPRVSDASASTDLLAFPGTTASGAGAPQKEFPFGDSNLGP